MSRQTMLTCLVAIMAAVFSSCEMGTDSGSGSNQTDAMSVMDNSPYSPDFGSHPQCLTTGGTCQNGQDTAPTNPCAEFEWIGYDQRSWVCCNVHDASSCNIYLCKIAQKSVSCNLQCVNLFPDTPIKDNPHLIWNFLPPNTFSVRDHEDPDYIGVNCTVQD